MVLVALRYAWARAAGPFSVALAEVSSGKAAFAEAFTRAWERFQSSKLTSTLRLSGKAMSPTFNDGPGAGCETLLVRNLPQPSRSTVFLGDVVVLASPLSAPPELLVRRVTALEGDEMVSDLPGDVDFRVPVGHVWVTSDNERLPLKDAPDSRQFGPVAFSSVTGRAVYSLRAATDHGSVRNSDEAAEADGPVLAAELDVEALAKLS